MYVFHKIRETIIKEIKTAILLNINVLVGNFIKTNIMVSIDNSFANLIVSLQKKINLK